MKKIGILLLILACIFGCTGCICSHDWVEADCYNPKTCPLCGRTEGQSPGHRWQSATCLAPQTCGLCGLTQGDRVDHGWSEATCAAPKTCQWCGLTEGEILPHNWEKATTEAPRTCSYCKATDGDRIITDERFTTAENRMLFGTWVANTVMSGEDLNLENFMDQIAVVVTYVFCEDGAMEKHITIEDMDAFTAELITLTEERLYAQFEDMDMDQEAADEAFFDAYDMTISQYAEDFWTNADLAGMLDVHGIQGVYYATGDSLNTAANWVAEEFASHPFTVDGDKLTLTEPDGTTLELTKMSN